jgi:hypothetical protein
VRRSGVGLVAIAMLVAGCSDDATTKDEFGARADAVCHEATIGPARWERTTHPDAGACHLARRATESDYAALDRLWELERPPSDLATIGTVVTGATSRRDDARMRK